MHLKTVLRRFSHTAVLKYGTVPVEGVQLAFLDAPQCPLSREQLLNLTHGQQTGSLERSVDVLISRLLRKIEEDPHDPLIIKTVRSGGHIFTAAVERR